MVRKAIGLLWISLTRGYLQQKLKLHKGESHSLRSWLKKELQDGQLQSLLRGSSMFSSSNTEPDPLLSSFIYNMPMVDVTESMQPSSSTEVNFEKKSLDENMLERYDQISLSTNLYHSCSLVWYYWQLNHVYYVICLIMLFSIGLPRL